MDTQATLMQLRNDFRNNPHIRITEDISLPPLSAEEIERACMEHHITSLFAGVRELYQSTGGCSLRWECDLDAHPAIKKYAADDSILNGIIEIFSLDRFLTFDDTLRAPWWQENLRQEEREDLLNFRTFYFNDDNTRVGFIIEDGQVKEEEFYFLMHERQGFFPFDYTYEEFWKWCTHYRGFQGWQYNLMFPESPNFERMEFYCKQLFNQ